MGEFGRARSTSQASAEWYTWGANTIGRLLVTQVGFWPPSVVPSSAPLPAREYQTLVP